MILQIAVPVPLHQIFDYLPPNSLCEAHIGSRVKVPFGHRSLVGVLVGKSDQSIFGLEKLKHAKEIIDKKAIFTKHQISLAQWAAAYYCHPLGEVLQQMLPTRLRKGLVAEIDEQVVWCLSDVGRWIELSDLKHSTKQTQVWRLLKNHSAGLTQDTLLGLGFGLPTLRALQKKGWVASVNTSCVESMTPGTICEETPGTICEDQSKPFQKDDLLLEHELKLNIEQHQVILDIKSKEGFRTHLLQGVTGSGKTEIYLQFIASIIKQGQQALVLVPEINLTPQIMKRFETRFSCPILSLHSKVSEKKKQNDWLTSQLGSPCIGIGTRSAIWAPFSKLGVIIIDEEHDISFKQQEGFFYSARDVAIYRAKQLNIPIILGTATPSLETWYNVKKSKYYLSTLKHRAGNAKAPNIYLEDLRCGPTQFGLSQTLIKKIEQHLAQKDQVLLFLNRRGYAPTLFCNDCGWLAVCPYCDAKLTFHRNAGQLRCHFCEFKQKVPVSCSTCQSQDLSTSGQGTEKLEDHLQQLFPHVNIIRVDSDTTVSKTKMEQYLNQIHKGDPCLLIGTQMLSKGHHFPNVTLVIVVNIDAGFLSSDFRAAERACQLLTQVSGRAGRGVKPGQVWVQTHHPNYPLLQVWLKQDYQTVSNFLLEERLKAGLPPYSFVILVRAESVKKELSKLFLQKLSQLLSKSIGDSELENFFILGPATAPMERKANRFRMQLLLQSNSRKTLHKQFKQAFGEIDTISESKSVRWSVEVDPQQLF